MKNEFFFPSKDGVTKIHAIEWVPEGEMKGVLQICHGMVEYIDRYHDFAEFLAQQGYYVVGHDHLGHGQSVVDESKLGYFQEPDGNACVIADIHKLRLLTEQKYGGKPYFIMGHSMGSFLVRQYLGMYGTGLTGAIIMGTGDQPSAVLGAGKTICKLIGALKGWEHRSEFVNNMAFGSYNKKFEALTDGSNWLSRNPENVKKYNADPLCGYLFTVNAYYHMFSGMAKMNEQENAGKIPKHLAVFFVAGKEDPVGSYGAGVEKVYQRFLKSGIQNVSMKLYENDRHEILQEVDREVVFKDIGEWLEKSV